MMLFLKAIIKNRNYYKLVTTDTVACIPVCFVFIYLHSQENNFTQVAFLISASNTVWLLV